MWHCWQKTSFDFQPVNISTYEISHSISMEIYTTTRPLRLAPTLPNGCKQMACLSIWMGSLKKMNSTHYNISFINRSFIRMWECANWVRLKTWIANWVSCTKWEFDHSSKFLNFILLLPKAYTSNFENNKHTFWIYDTYIKHI